jgi:hypothetical protein
MKYEERPLTRIKQIANAISLVFRKKKFDMGSFE